MIDVVIVATAIKTRFWKEYYLNLLKNNSSFHLVFCGNRKPNFRLPNNFTFLFSEEKPSKCAQNCYDFASKNLKSKFIMHTADDFIFHENYIDKLIAGYEKNKLIYPNKPLMVTQLSIAPNGEYDRMAIKDGDPLLGIGPLTTVENNNLIGGIDKRFNSVCWDMDRVYRFYALGGIIIPLPESECPLVKERSLDENVNYAWSQHHNKDMQTFNDLWVSKKTNNKIITNYYNGNNTFLEGTFSYERTDNVHNY